MGWLVIAEWMSRLVLIILLGLSFWSVAIMIERRRFFKSVQEPFAEISEKLKNGKLDLKSGSISGQSASSSADKQLSGRLLSELQKYSDQERSEKAFIVFANQERKYLEKGLPVLGTLGSTTPFIGLFGTILGIIVSFGRLSSGGGNTNAVMYSLAEALILTAVGLLVAIPAVIALNYFSRQARGILSELSTLKDLYLVVRV